MFRKIMPRLIAFVSTIKEKISFIPALLSITAFILGVVLISFRDAKIEYLFFKTPLIKIHSIETLRSILAAFLTSLVSITIFSFSMVMLILNQAATHYSPKILNWLVGKKTNQYTLGVYLGTIIFTILLLIQLPKNSEFKPAYHFAIVLDAGLTFYCLILFVSFVNRVSADIQVSNIIESIYKKTKKKLRQEKNNTINTLNTVESEWISFNSNDSGYLQKISQNHLLKILKDNNLKMKIIHRFGYYHIKHTPLFYLDRAVNDDLLEDINSNFIFYSGERIEDHTFYGFRQLTEIAIKALSPGINDPGTASTCLDYLLDLFAELKDNDAGNIIRDKSNEPRIFIHSYTFIELFDMCMIPILNYGKKDPSVVKGIMEMLRKLSALDTHQTYQKELNRVFVSLFNVISGFKETSYIYEDLQNDYSQLQNEGKNYFKNPL